MPNPDQLDPTDQPAHPDRIERLSTAEKAALTSGASLWRSTPVESAGIPSILLTDGPHGVRVQRETGASGLFDSVPATCFPPAVGLAATWNPELIRQVGEVLGAEARARGVGVLLGPGINLKRSPLCGRNFEYYSEDPVLTATLATEWVRGLQSQGVGAGLKHFAVNNQETDRMRVSADLDERTLREVYLWAFQRVVQRAQPWTVMCSYNRINGVYSTENRWLLTELLRGEWGFTGLVMSDWTAVDNRVVALRAGLDLAMPGPDGYGDQAVVDAIADGTLDPAALDTAVQRVLTLVDRVAAGAGTGAPPEPAGDETAEHHALIGDETAEHHTLIGDETAEHHTLARQVAASAIVLLKNDGGLLPLGPGSGRIAVLGELARTPRYQGGGSSQITPTQLDDALTWITALAPTPVTFATGYSLTGDPDPERCAEAVEVAKASDVAIVFAGTLEETEGADRPGIELAADQRELIERVAAVNARTVVVLSNGSVLATTPWDRAVPALLEGWLLGQAGGAALADVLFGRVNPAGRLAETIPLRLADHPSFLDFPGEAGHVRYSEGIHAGYRWFDARDLPVAYPFGFGLSYTTFEYGPASAVLTGTGIELRVPVTNSGSRDGREVVQVYVSAPGKRVRRAARELKGFANVAIAAGQTVEATITIAREDLAYWDPAVARWVVEGGQYRLAVGASSRDLRGTVTVEVPGDAVAAPLTAQSTVREWLEHPRGGPLIQRLLTASGSTGGSTGGGALLSAVFTDPQLLVLTGGTPLSRITAMSNGAVTPDMIDELVSAATAAG